MPEQEADPVVLAADAAVRQILKQCKNKNSDALSTVYRIFLLGAVGALKECGQPHEAIAANLRSYADRLEKKRVTTL